jgi:hypothetical protein
MGGHIIPNKGRFSGIWKRWKRLFSPSGNDSHEIEMESEEPNFIKHNRSRFSNLNALLEVEKIIRSYLISF